MTNTEQTKRDETPLLSAIARTLAAATLVSFIAIGGSFLITPKYTSSAQILPPQQSQSAAAALLGSLGNLAGAAAGAAGTIVGQSPSDQWIGLLKSRSIADPIIGKFNLKAQYETDFDFEARDELAKRTKIEAGKDSLIDISVEDENGEQAKLIVEEYIAQLRNLSQKLALSESGQRRMFYEEQLKAAKKSLIQAEQDLTSAGISPEALKANPELSVSLVATQKAKLQALEIQQSILRQSLTDQSPEVRAIQSEMRALSNQIEKSTSSIKPNTVDPSKPREESYISKFREFKYQETLYELLARQYELARSDESRDGTIIQIVDAASTPEKKSSPKRSRYAITAFLLTLFAGFAFYIVKRNLFHAAQKPDAGNDILVVARLFGFRQDTQSKQSL